jgi:hypothetical protein
MKLEKRNNELLGKWKLARPEYKTFMNDGILCESIYNKTIPRICFLLKEGNDNFIDIAPIGDDEGYGPDGNSKVFWRLMSSWIYVMTCAWNNLKLDEKVLYEYREKPVNSVAYINIKKFCENKSNSNHNDLFEYARRDKEFLLKQMEIANPDIIYCGGTKSLFDELYKSHEIEDRVYLANKRIIVDYYHPSCRKGYKTANELYLLLTKKKVKMEINNIKISVKK